MPEMLMTPIRLDQLPPEQRERILIDLFHVHAAPADNPDAMHCEVCGRVADAPKPVQCSTYNNTGPNRY